MGRYRKILVAVDGSDSSTNAFRQACRISRKDKSWISVITAIPPYQDQFQSLGIKEKVSRALKREGERILSDIKRTAEQEDVYIRTILAEGSPVSAIVDAAGEGGYDLTVMGRYGKSRLERALVGSVTAGVIGYSPNDVLVVPKDTAISWENILLATDGSRYSEAATDSAINLAGSYSGTLKVVSIVDVPPELYAEAPNAVENLTGKAKGFVESVKAEASNISVSTFVREGEAYKIITDLARSEGVDVIVMGSHGRTGIKRLLMGSVAERVIGHAPCPILIVKGQ